MSAFLQRLIDRHSLAPAVRPRAAVRFPPATRSDDTAASTVETPMSMDGGGGTRQLPPRVTPVAQRIPIVGAGAGADAAMRLPTATLAPATDATPHHRRAVDTAADSTTSVGSGLRQPRTDDETMGRAGADDAAASIEFPLGTAGRITPATDHRRGASAVTPRIVISQAEWAADPAPIRAGDSGAAAPAAPDVIQVHIGRLEVRAVMPAVPPQPRPSRRESGALPLEQYLAGRQRR